MLSRAIQHEVDHLNGILMEDSAKEYQDLGPLRDDDVLDEWVIKNKDLLILE